ncbi:hypothetical protein LTR08_002637 [Meristemomyces frigidus]|nr:hypothetical protein LTR08_002637 [Meristemomyces frigidus]
MASIKLSARHQELMYAVIKHMAPGDINFTSVAEDSNYSSAKYARDEWKKIRDKLTGGETGASGTKSKRKAADKDDDGSPVKKTKAIPRKSRKATPVKATTADDDDKAAEGVIRPEPENEDDWLH